MKRIGIILLGIIIVTIGILRIVTSSEMVKKCIEPAEGIVVEIEQDEFYNSDDGRYEYTYYPVIKYEAKGRTVEERYDVGSSKSEYSIGEQVNILYNPDNVEQYLIEGYKSSNILEIAFIIVGVFVVVAGIFGKIY